MNITLPLLHHHKSLTSSKHICNTLLQNYICYYIIPSSLKTCPHVSHRNILQASFCLFAGVSLLCFYLTTFCWLWWCVFWIIKIFHNLEMCSWWLLYRSTCSLCTCSCCISMWKSHNFRLTTCTWIIRLETVKIYFFFLFISCILYTSSDKHFTILYGSVHGAYSLHDVPFSTVGLHNHSKSLCKWFAMYFQIAMLLLSASTVQWILSGYAVCAFQRVTQIGYILTVCLWFSGW